MHCRLTNVITPAAIHALGSRAQMLRALQIADPAFTHKSLLDCTRFHLTEAPEAFNWAMKYLTEFIVSSQVMYSQAQLFLIT